MPEDIRKEILKKVKQYYLKSKLKEKFIPGQDYIPYAGRVYDEKELGTLIDSSLDFWLTEGRYAKEFEKRFCKFLNVKHCILANSGSSANLLAITALTSNLLKERAIKAGDEIITTACGFPTTLSPIIQNNLVPVILDIELGNYNINTKTIEKAINNKTKAIFVAHTLGNPNNINEILKLARKYNLWFIEDNCDALGSKYDNKFTGAFGDMATFSFYPAHQITMGEGGAVVTNNNLLKKIIKSFRDWGRDCFCETGKDNSCGIRFNHKYRNLPSGYDHKYIYSHIGYNLKLTDMQAAVGVAQLKKLPYFIKMRRKNFDILYTHIDKYSKYLLLPEAMKNSDPCWFGFPIMVKESAPFTRNDIVQFLENNKIATRMLFGGNLIKQPAFVNSKYRIMGDLINTDLVMNNLFWIGVYPGITNDKMSYIIITIDKYIRGITN